MVRLQAGFRGLHMTIATGYDVEVLPSRNGRGNTMARKPPAGPDPVKSDPPTADRMATATTIDLVRRIQSGDHEAISALCARYLPRLRRWATGRLPRSARGLLETDDIVSETMVSTLRHLPDFEPRHEVAFQAYVRRALINRIRDEVRKLKPAAADLPEDARDPGPSPIEQVIGREVVERYEAALSRLTPEEQMIIHLRVELNLSHREIAEELDKPSADAARMAVSRALVQLARQMQDES